MEPEPVLVGGKFSTLVSRDGPLEPAGTASLGALARVNFAVAPNRGRDIAPIVAVVNQKGGVGKSTTAVNVAAYLAIAGGRVLLVDLDPQGNTTTGVGSTRDLEISLYDVLMGERKPKESVYPTGISGLDLLPSTIDLAGSEIELVPTLARETRLRRALEDLRARYDLVLVDCPPSLGLLTVNGLAAADELLIPIQCEYFALEGLGQLLQNVELIRANLNPALSVGGVVLTMYDARTRLAEQVVDEVRRYFGEKVYDAVIPRSVRLSEAPSYGQPIAVYDPMSRGGLAYRDLAREVAARSGLLSGEGAKQ